MTLPDLRDRAVSERRSFSVTLFASPLDREALRSYVQAGVTRFVFSLRPTPHEEPDYGRLRRALDEVGEASG